MTSERSQTPSSRCNHIRVVCFLALASLAGANRLAESADVGPLWLTAGVKPPPAASAKLEELLSRVGPNMRSSADYHDFRDVKLNESLEAWQILHRQVSEYADKQALKFKAPMLQLLKEANISSACLNSADETLEAAGQLKSWAIQMWSFSGSFPPVAQFAGNHHDMGSYKGCIDLVRPTAGRVSSEALTRYASTYCTVGFRPIVPTRPRFHLIFKQAEQELVNQYEADDIVGLVATRAQYFHYTYLKTGICVPSECTARDIQLVTRAIGRRLALTSAPVKCFTRSGTHSGNYSQLAGNSNQIESNDLDNLENNRPVQINLNRKMNATQIVASVIIGSFFLIVLSVTLWHGSELALGVLKSKQKFISSLDLNGQDSGRDARVESSGYNGRADIGNGQSDLSAKAENRTNLSIQTNDTTCALANDRSRRFKANLFHYFSIITNATEFCDAKMRPNEIECLHGFRVFTMLWIICVHVLQYCDWSGFTRIYENVPNLRNPLMHPVINANYVVDNFFLMSGLLASYTIWHSNKGTSVNFSFFRSLLARYLRLTPQVLLISLIYIVLPSINSDSGPFWYDMTHYAGKYCEKNWWVNLLHLQSFYRSDEICNLVGWWISVDMLYYLIGLVVLWMILEKWTSAAYWLSGCFVAFSIMMTAWRHYSWGLEPNNLALVPQVNEVWTEFVIKFFWSPYPHAYVFFLGIWLGYLMANKIGIQQVRRWSKLGWFLSLTSMTAVSMSSRLWLVDVLELSTDHQLLSTSYNIICVIAWANSFGWMIVACHYGCAPMLNQLLSIKIAVILSKASFIIYLSHMLVLRMFFGSQYNLFEVAMSIVIFQIVGITFLSILFGVFLCVTFEAPCMKMQRAIMEKIRPNRKLPQAGVSYNLASCNPQTSTSDKEKNSSIANATTIMLFK